MEIHLEIFLDCGFENISRGRCNFQFQKRKAKVDNLFIHSDKALMEVYFLTVLKKFK